MPEQLIEAFIPDNKISEIEANSFLEEASKHIIKLFEHVDQFATDFLVSQSEVDSFCDWMNRVRAGFKSYLTTEPFGLEELYMCVYKVNVNLYRIQEERKHILAKRESGKTKEIMSEDIHNILNDLISELNTSTRQHRVTAANKLEPHLNKYLKTMPSSNLEEKKAICSKLETILEPLGLAVEIPREPFLPGKLKATSGNRPGAGRFHFDVMIDGKQYKLASSDTLPALKLIDSYRGQEVESALPTPEDDSKWQSMVGPKAARQGLQIE